MMVAPIISGGGPWATTYGVDTAVKRHCIDGAIQKSLGSSGKPMQQSCGIC